MKKILGLRSYIDLTLGIILIAGLVYTLGFGVSLYIARQEVTAEVNDKVQRDAEHISSYVDTQLQRVEDVANTLLSLWQSADLQQASADDWFVCLERCLDANPHLCGAAIGFEPDAKTPAAGQYGFAAYVTNVTGQNERLWLGDIHDFHQKEWYHQAAQLGHSYWSRPFHETRMGKVVTSYSVPIHNATGQMLGVLALDIDTEAFRHKCRQVSPFHGSEVTILDRESRYVSHPDTAMIMQQASEAKDHAGSFYFVSPIQRNGWTITVECPKDEVLGGLSRMKRHTTAIAIVSILVMLMVMLWIFRRLQRVTISHTSIENELRLASALQQGMIPKHYPAFPGHSELDVCGFLQPARSVGGDLYDYCLRDGKLYFCIGDVSGKGIPASLFMTVTVALFRNVSLHLDDPAAILASLNDTISHRNEHCMFCTMFVGVLDIQSGLLSYCNGGHNAPIVRRLDAKGQAVVSYMQVQQNIAVGLFEGFAYQTESIQLAHGESLFLYTDGVTEAEDRHHQLMGEDATLAALADAYTQQAGTAQDVVDSVYSSIRKHVLNAEQSDDITMLAIEYR